MKNCNVFKYKLKKNKNYQTHQVRHSSSRGTENSCSASELMKKH